MAGVVIAGLLTGCGVYYISRVVPRIVQRASLAQGAATFSTTYPYHAFEYGFQKKMSEKEAFMLLGFGDKVSRIRNRPSEEDVKKRYRNLMKELHSDVNGSPYVATKLNQAKETLLK